MIEVDLYKCRKSFKSFPMNAQSRVCISFLRAFDMLIYISSYMVPILYTFHISLCDAIYISMCVISIKHEYNIKLE